MRYTWECATCKEHTVVDRKLADIDSPPESCEHCLNTELKRIVVPHASNIKGFILLGDHGWSHTDYTRYRSIK